MQKILQIKTKNLEKKLYSFGFQFFMDHVKSGMRFGLSGLFYQDLGPNLKGQYFVSFLKKKRNKTRREQ